jgi:hypothetical protein
VGRNGHKGQHGEEGSGFAHGLGLQMEGTVGRQAHLRTLSLRSYLRQ